MSAPAGMVIFNSFVALHTMFQNVYDGINTAAGLAGDKAGVFVETFSPIVGDIEDQKKLKLLLDGLQTALILGAAPAFHTVLARVPWAKANPQMQVHVSRPHA